MSLTADETSDPPPDFALSAKYATDLQVRIERVAKRAVRTVRCRALLLVGVTIGSTLLAAAVWDAWWRSPQPSLRWVLFGLILIAAGSAVFFWLIPAFRLRLSVLEAARKIELYFPEFGDRLSSVVALNEPQEAARSERSEQLVHRGTIETYQRIDSCALTDALQPHRNRHLAILALALVGIFVLGLSLLPQQAPLALKRVSMPWLNAPWPRQHILEIEPLPRRVHAGSDFVVTVRDRHGQLPVDVTLLMRRDSKTEPMRLPLGTLPEEANASGKATTTATISGEQVKEHFAIRAVGGDDRTMPWHEIEVVSPPRIRSERFHVTPPDYTALPSFETDDPVFSVPAGSRVEFEAAIDRPLKTAEWSTRSVARSGRSDATDSAVVVSEVPVSAQPNETLPDAKVLRLDRDGTSLQSTWTLPATVHSQSLHIGWIDREGVPGRSAKRWKINVEPDQPPRVAWHDLSTSSHVSADAVIPLKWHASDDFGLANSAIEIMVTRPSTSGESSQPEDGETHFLQDAESASDRPAPRQLRRSGSLDLSSFETIPPGATLQIVGVATDTLGQRGLTEPLHFRLIAEEALQSRMADAGRKILEQVRDAKAQQQLALERTEESRSRLGDDAESKQATADLLRIAEAAQEATVRRLDGGPQAAIDTATSLLREAQINQLDNRVTSAVAEAVEQLKTTRDQAVLPANAALQNASDQLRQDRAERKSIDPLLHDAIADQQRSAGELQEIVDALSSSLQVESAAQSIRDLADAQRRLSGATVRSEEASRPEAERTRLSTSQQALAREAEQLQSQLEQLARSADQSEERRERFHHASEQLSQQRAPQRMREAAESLREDRVGDSVTQQREISEDLANVARELQQGDASRRDADDRSEWLREATRIADRQSAIADAIADVIRRDGVGSDQAVNDQQDHARRTERFASTVDAIPLFGDAARSAQRDMLAAAARLERNATASRALDDAQAAAEQMSAIAEAFQAAAANRPSESQAGEEETPETGEASEEAEQAPIPLETVFLLRSVQARLQANTKQLETLQQRNLSQQERTEVQRKRQNIASEQSRLMTQLNELMQKGEEK